MDKECGAVGAEVVGHAAASADEHGRRRIGGDMDKNAFLRVTVRCAPLGRVSEMRGT